MLSSIIGDGSVNIENACRGRGGIGPGKRRIDQRLERRGELRHGVFAVLRPVEEQHKASSVQGERDAEEVEEERRVIEGRRH